MTTPKLLSIQVARAQPLLIEGKPILSAIEKTNVSGAVTVKPLGLDGDEQADLSVHGGLSKAVYAYPSEHYPYWREQQSLLGLDNPLPYGSMGENLTLSGLLEQDVYVGDELHFADCVLRVTEPRQPCFKFNAVMNDKRAAKKMAHTGYCGFYLAVVRTGTLNAGETFTLVPGARDTAISELFKVAMRKTASD